MHRPSCGSARGSDAPSARVCNAKSRAWCCLLQQVAAALDLPGAQQVASLAKTP